MVMVNNTVNVAELLPLSQSSLLVFVIPSTMYAKANLTSRGHPVRSNTQRRPFGASGGPSGAVEKLLVMLLFRGDIATDTDSLRPSTRPSTYDWPAVRPAYPGLAPRLDRRDCEQP